MRVALKELPCQRHIDLPSTFVDESVRGLAVREALEMPPQDPSGGSAEADVNLYQEGDNVFARGKLAGFVAVACSRCLEPVKITFEEQLTVTFMPKAALPDLEDEAVEPTDTDLLEEEVPAKFSDDDEDLYPFDGEVVDLAPLFREQIVMTVPYAPLCKEDCLGLCSQCGTNLNNKSCSCPPIVDPRLASLRQFKV